MANKDDALDRIRYILSAGNDRTLTTDVEELLGLMYNYFDRNALEGFADHVEEELTHGTTEDDEEDEPDNDFYDDRDEPDRDGENYRIVPR